MDSMRSLNRSLPQSNSSQPAPPEQLLQAFRDAALSITNLYKSAVTDQTISRQAGYQDALDDLLAFLDKENLGVKGGEGWRIRQWATERFERASTGQQNAESDDDRGDSGKRARSSSPVMTRKQSPDATLHRDTSRSTSPMRTESAPPPQARGQAESDSQERPTMFTFTAQASVPNDAQFPNSAPSSLNHTANDESGNDPQIETSESTPIRVEVVNRIPRTPHRHQSSRHHPRSSIRDIPFPSGTKRKLQFPDFFDISNVGSGKDGLGGGKRGRFV